MTIHKMIIYAKASALTVFSMLAGAGSCYHIMAEPAPYIMPVEMVSYEVETFLSENVLLEHENDTLQAKMITESEKMITENEEPLTEVAPEQLYDIPLSAELQHSVCGLAEKYELPRELVLAVIMTESSGRPDLTGDGGDAIGLMQIQPKWYGELISETGLSVDEPVENVELGILILLGFLKENDGNLDRALKQYNSGNPDYEGNEYIERVHEWLDYFEKEAAG